MAEDGNRGTQRALIGAGLAAATAGAAAAAFLWNRKLNQDQDDRLIGDAPPWTLKQQPVSGPSSLTGTTVTIGRPRDDVYAEWRDFNRFPRFMENVERVEKLDESRSRWTIKAPAGSTVELVTEITADESGKRIAWKSTDGPNHAGVVTFHRLNDAESRVSVQFEWEPGSATEKIGAAFGADNAQVKSDLKKFKDFVESNGATGGWRGSVDSPPQTGETF